ncbi:MAG: M48 family metalloprotease [Proteobacteria bacterium]|nr:M48 family metalloprotease [Pseudomonadota bacterium]MBU4296989.1 M48 family metalloprotease [Pseudomonadota bacterium]MCG2749870.1 M48 family metalloprotease [Desulfobulbaceae bacterium]
MKKKPKHPLLFLCLACVWFLLAGCAINPVTGERELGLVGQEQEIAIGNQQYTPARQMQGGDYLADPEVSAYVNSVGQKLAAVSDRPLPYEFKVLNNSTPNAWALPGGKIVMNRGLLLELHNEAELAAVISHEIVHAAARHGAKSMEKGMLLQGALLATTMATSGNDYAPLAVGGAQVAASLITQKYSREAELEADYYGMHYMSRAGYDPQSAVNLQQTFVRLSEGRDANWLSGLFASHPPSPERVEANRKTAKSLPAGGDLGEKRYAEQTRHLRQTAPAYKSYDEAVLAAKKGDSSKSLALVNSALAIEPKEALFYGLQGDILFEQKNFNKALASYDQALHLNDNYFHFYAQRGLTREKLGDIQGARQDLTRSANLLPTATAYKKLGDFALAAGQQTEAKNFFKAAASSQSQVGKEALASFIKLDLPENAGSYITARPERTQDGQLIIRVANPTPLTVYNIVLKARYLDDKGAIKEIPLRVSTMLQPKESVTLPLDGVGVPTKYLHNLEVKVISAQTAAGR